MPANHKAGDISAPFMQSLSFEDNDYLLTETGLNAQAIKNNSINIKWRSPVLRFLSFTHGWLTLMNTYSGAGFQLSFKVTDDKLLLHCGCGNSAASLCAHAFYAIRYLIYYHGTRYFKKLRPSGEFELAQAHARYFRREEQVVGLMVSPKPELGRTFAVNDELQRLPLSSFITRPAKQAESQNGQAPGYLLVFSHNNRHLPFVIPCCGQLTKNNTAIKSFGTFLSGLHKQNEPLLTEAQKEINGNSRQLYRLAESLKGSIITENGNLNITEQLQQAFNLWQKLARMLQYENHVYTYLLYHLKELKRRPAKSKTARAGLCTCVPEIRFTLKNIGPFFQLEMLVLIAGKPLVNYNISASFFVRQGEKLYLFGCLRDAAVAQWMFLSNGLITVFKEQFRIFEQEVLKPLSEYYPVKMLASRQASNRKQR